MNIKKIIFIFITILLIIILSILILDVINNKKIISFEEDKIELENLNSVINSSKSLVDNGSFDYEILDSNYNSEISPHLNETENSNFLEKRHPEKSLFSPGEYAIIKNCNPILGNSNSPLKILIVNINNAIYFEEIKSDIIENQLKKITPFKENFNNIVVYSLNINTAEELGCNTIGTILSGSGVYCDNFKIYAEIEKRCSIDDLKGIITIAIIDSNYGGSGGDIIYVGSNSYVDKEVNLGLKKNIAIHEIGHNFGLADLYYGNMYLDGSPSKFGDINYSRSFLNVDGPGCSKWCNSYKPVSEYTESLTSKCLTFTEKQDCISFGRDSERFCNYEGIDAACCVWSDEKFEYFNTNCVPIIGNENIGLDCLEGAGCYFGAFYGNYAWRPVNSQGFSESIMYGLSTDSFDSVSERELSKVFKCCLSEESSGLDCVDFRKTYSDFLENINFKKRIGSCGYKK